ncbi:hypothetical protein B0I72DRAFT_164480 [Yarrowia lipolytica]|uniref:YALI0C12188p n=2 Tax=Yarrowia lipolytica TaxID=4952 RepID=Q6CC61_YARLI|nr:YALI0C12188p [Yarrowia lipolytica CLIB122]RDW27915.1 hypothetical protein B0I71DRAFT_168686 [Yarrowia lipolytica]RDW32849.1 hypothetical protein B0I72DRAFT_164480 [Yarrowia lipolytica]RDW38061.1 hypothetical protein B0I73DRAFT_166090 [Yarrowia lipolytica]RDW47871.1 hypothetical protein B0I74DRAFT_162060 [Yarrowia lipolytica]RDW55022.1 hypothetical protein B0I75DRAFT_170386 [Yarrowia lipolytica]|eukprot:XP_501751.1 YALI0C12188p [Yarrowia lipolytica CLIB122]
MRRPSTCTEGTCSYAPVKVHVLEISPSNHSVSQYINHSISRLYSRHHPESNSRYYGQPLASCLVGPRKYLGCHVGAAKTTVTRHPLCLTILQNNRNTCPTPQPPKRSTSSPVRRGVRVVILASDVGSLKTRFGHSLDPHWSGWLGLLSPTFQVSDCTLVLTQAEMSGIQVSDIVREGGESGEGERRTTGWRGVFGPLLDGLREG